MLRDAHHRESEFTVVQRMREARWPGPDFGKGALLWSLQACVLLRSSLLFRVVAQLMDVLNIIAGSEMSEEELEIS